MSDSSEKKRKTLADDAESDDAANLLAQNAELQAKNAELQQRLAQMQERKKLRAHNALLEKANKEFADKIALLEKDDDGDQEKAVVETTKPAAKTSVRAERQPAFEWRQPTMRCKHCHREINGLTQSSNWDCSRGAHVMSMVQLCAACERGSLKMF
jgi:hypothetical protein